MTEKELKDMIGSTVNVECFYEGKKFKEILCKADSVMIGEEAEGLALHGDGKAEYLDLREADRLFSEGTYEREIGDYKTVYTVKEKFDMSKILDSMTGKYIHVDNRKFDIGTATMERIMGGGEVVRFHSYDRIKDWLWDVAAVKRLYEDGQAVVEGKTYKLKER